MLKRKERAQFISFPINDVRHHHAQSHLAQQKAITLAQSFTLYNQPRWSGHACCQKVGLKMNQLRCQCLRPIGHPGLCNFLSFKAIALVEADSVKEPAILFHSCDQSALHRQVTYTRVIQIIDHSNQQSRGDVPTSSHCEPTCTQYMLETQFLIKCAIVLRSFSF